MATATASKSEEPKAPTAPTPAKTAKADSVLVSITKDGYKPDKVCVKLNGSVTWKNDTDAVHTVSFAEPPATGMPPDPKSVPAVCSGDIAPGESFTHAFAADINDGGFPHGGSPNNPGEYPYHDRHNPKGMGCVKVELA